MESIQKLLNADGAVTRWPKHPDERLDVLKYLLTKFEAEKKYSEMQVNMVIKKWHAFNDHPLLRRELLSANMMDRTPDGKEYWVK